MPKDTPVTVTLRVTQTTRDLLKQAAELDHRSMANMVEVLILNHCKANEISSSSRRKSMKPVLRRDRRSSGQL